MKKHILPITITAIIVACALWFAYEPKEAGGQLSGVPIENILEHETIKVKECKKYGTTSTPSCLEYKIKDIKRFTYIDKEVEDYNWQGRLTENKDKRTENTRFYDDGNETHHRMYYGKPFVKDNGKWYRWKKATSTVEDFNVAFSNSAFAATFVSGAGDGLAWEKDLSAWNDVHDADPSSSASHIDAEEAIAMSFFQGSNDYLISRGFLPIDTSAIADDETVTTSTLYMRITVIDNADGDAQSYIAVVNTTQQDTSQVQTSDYAKCGDAVDNPTKGSDDHALSGLTINQFNGMSLNATGLGWIDISGVTKLGIREGHDIEDIPVQTGKSKVTINFSESGSEPYLDVTSELIASGASSGAKMMMGGGW